MFQIKVVEKTKIHILYLITFFLKSCGLWDDVEKYCGAREAADGNLIWRMRVECWISKAEAQASSYAATPTHTHTSARTHSHTRAEVCNSLLVACPRQQRFRERASMVSFMCIACLVLLTNLYVLSQNYEMRLLALSCLSVRPTAWKNSSPTGRIFNKTDIWVCSSSDWVRF
jgi:hypothetical protein